MKKAENKKNVSILIKAASFGFACVSWKATALGLEAYVFHNKIEAMVVSFGVQLLLFVLNLRLPGYYSVLKNNASTAKGVGKLKTAILIVGYAIILVTSSLFSFVYICDAAVYGSNTGYLDDDVILADEYRECAIQTKQYIDEAVHATRLIAARQIAEISVKFEDKKKDTKETLSQEVEKSKSTMAEKKSAYLSAKKMRKQSEEDLEVGRGVMASNNNVYRSTLRNYETAIKKEEDTWTEYQNAKRKLENDEERLNGYEMSKAGIADELLTAILTEEKGDKSVKECIDTLTNYAVKDPENDVDIAQYSDYVTRLKKLTITVDYLDKFEKQQDVEALDIEGLDTGKDMIPNPANTDSFGDELAIWRRGWEQKYDSLEDVLQALPDLSDSTLDEYEEDLIQAMVDVDTIKQYKLNGSAGMLRRISDVRRGRLTDINIMERARNVFFSRYCFTPVVSLMIALLLDLLSLGAGIFLYEHDKEG